MHLIGIEPESIVRIVAVEPAGADAVNVTYRLPSGQILEKSVFRADEAKLAVAAAESQFTFAASPADFKLAAEATRIKLAHLFDPMMAIHTSNAGANIRLRPPACRTPTTRRRGRSRAEAEQELARASRRMRKAERT